MDSNPATGCVTCNLGQYTPRKAVACTDCPAGKADTDYSSRTECAGASRSLLQPWPCSTCVCCADCDADTYAPAGSMECTRCFAGALTRRWPARFSLAERAVIVRFLRPRPGPVDTLPCLTQRRRRRPASVGVVLYESMEKTMNDIAWLHTDISVLWFWSRSRCRLPTHWPR